MNAPRYAETVSKVLSTTLSRADAEAPAPSADARARAIAAIETALVAKRARARARRVALTAGIGGLAVAAAVALFTVRHSPSAAPVSTLAPAATATAITMVGYPTGSGATVEAGGQAGPLALVDGTRLVKGSHVVARADGGVTLALSTGTKLSMSDGANLSVDGDGPVQIFSLGSGSVRAEVAKLVGDQRFLVRTADTEVEVRGTVFQVSRVSEPGSKPPCGDTLTRVAVSEGVVVVRHAGAETRVRAGESWPTGCASAPAAAANVTTNTIAAPAARVPRVPHETARSASDPIPASEVNEPSRLAEQNDLFEHGLAARRGGKSADAVRDFEVLMRRYPGGPLAENASVERMRTLRTVDAARAAQAARDYLKSYPSGFARSEATPLAEAPR